MEASLAYTPGASLDLSPSLDIDGWPRPSAVIIGQYKSSDI
jgi:hypothetical protein